MRPEICVVPLEAVESILVDDASLRVLCLLASETLVANGVGMLGNPVDLRNELTERLGYDSDVLDVAIARLELAGFLSKRYNGTYDVRLARSADWRMPESLPALPGEDTANIPATLVAEAERPKRGQDNLTRELEIRGVVERPSSNVADAVAILLHTYANLEEGHYAAREIAEAIDLLQPGAIAEAWPSRRQVTEQTVKAKPPRRSAISVSTRYRILKRDNFKCVYCGRNASETSIEIDHYTPVAAGGSNDDANLRAACRDCNAGKGATPP
jgi:DNA-binding transcriptional ArsR family regulator